MPLPYCRKRGRSFHFRAKVPLDLIDRFATRELVRSIGRPSAGEARRLLTRLKLQADVVFMSVRANPDLDRAAIARVTALALGGVEEHIDDALGAIGSKLTADPLDEPAFVAARLAGVACLARSALERGGVDGAIATGIRLGEAALARPASFDATEQRRLARATLEGVRTGAETGVEIFARMAARRPQPPLVTRIVAEHEESTLDDASRAALRASGWSEAGADPFSAPLSCAPLSCASASSAPTHPAPPHPASPYPRSPYPASPYPRSLGLDPDSAGAGGWARVNAGQTLSALWPAFVRHKILNQEWRHTEEISARSTLALLVQILGDRPLSAYTPLDIKGFQEVFFKLPASYAQAAPWRALYEKGGALAVVEAAADGPATARTSAKSWNKHYARANGLFAFAASPQGLALAKDAPNPFDGFFIKIRKARPTRAQKEDRRHRIAERELTALFTAPKFLGAQSASRWSHPGALVVRDHRYWLPLIGFLHGMRRAEPTLLKVKHVRQDAATAIWYFDLEAPELFDALKAIGSARHVPLHATLIALGFLEARVVNRDPEERLFPDAESSGELGDDAGPFGQWFLRFRRSVEVDDPNSDFHASRHTFISLLLESGVPREHVEGIVGHETDGRRSAINDYVTPMRLSILKIAIDRVVLPIDVDAFKAAVVRSDAVDPSAAWPDLSVRPKWSRGKTSSC